MVALSEVYVMAPDRAALASVLRIGRILRTHRGGRAVVAMQELFVCARAYAEAVDGPVTNNREDEE